MSILFTFLPNVEFRSTTPTNFMTMLYVSDSCGIVLVGISRDAIECVDGVLRVIDSKDNVLVEYRLIDGRVLRADENSFFRCRQDESIESPTTTAEMATLLLATQVSRSIQQHNLADISEWVVDNDSILEPRGISLIYSTMVLDFINTSRQNIKR